MILQGNVKGGVYPITQQAYDEPIDGTKRCRRCGRKFDAMRNRRYCSDECRKLANAEKHRECSRRYAERARRLKTT